MDLTELWKAVLGEIRLSISKANYLTWFKNSFIKEIKDGVAFIGVSSNFSKEWLEQKYHKNIYQILTELEPSIKKVEYVVAPTTNPINLEDAIETKKYLKKKSFSLENQPTFYEMTIDLETNLNPKYTFENFIVGSYNELANAAALAVTESLGTKYNPLFVYGGVGLGKTHLLQAIGNKVKKERKKTKILYVSAEKFTEDLVRAIMEQKMSDFKNKFRNLDLLLIDDIQFIAGKDKAQEEIFHTFNTLSQKNKQVVFTSDRPPKAIPSIEERLRSRFEGGMTADIGYPDLETRLAILKIKNQPTQHLIPEESLYYLAESIPKNIRDLEGGLNRLIAHVKLLNRPITLEETKNILSSVLNKPNEYISPQKVIKKVASFYDLKEEEILSHSRKKELVKPRQIIMYLLREEMGYAFTNIAEKMGQRDHTTVIHACRKITKEMEKNPVFAQEVFVLKDLLYNK
ncbi:MAG TPA: chromosomal replication initiator protein DnaA [Candidatus Paceibacterota bacterium]|nr:chromosomal replication initiator protein DnaA [Candidatus Paceibacterota bacterium]HOK97331.1 chromosomal replication initiator protein DnaA [Candidatus Paceibacterota bacterium]HPP64775.1 chromosomal replication initiator protein DnaA [Candidatus Paceibacterota bacterium]